MIPHHVVVDTFKAFDSIINDSPQAKKLHVESELNLFNRLSIALCHMHQTTMRKLNIDDPQIMIEMGEGDHASTLQRLQRVNNLKRRMPPKIGLINEHMNPDRYATQATMPKPGSPSPGPSNVSSGPATEQVARVKRARATAEDKNIEPNSKRQAPDFGDDGEIEDVGMTGSDGEEWEVVEK